MPRRVCASYEKEVFFRALSRKRNAPHLLRFAQTAPFGGKNGGLPGETQLWYRLWSAGKRKNKTEQIKQKSYDFCRKEAKIATFLVRVAGFEPTASWSRTKRATNCATPGCSLIIIRNFPADVKGKSPAVQIVPVRHIPRRPVIHCGRD